PAPSDLRSSDRLRVFPTDPARPISARQSPASAGRRTTSAASCGGELAERPVAEREEILDRDAGQARVEIHPTRAGGENEAVVEAHDDLVDRLRSAREDGKPSSAAGLPHARDA